MLNTRLSPSSLSRLAIGLIVCPALLSAQAVANQQESDAQWVLNTLSEDACYSTPVEDVTPQKGLPKDRVLVCGNAQTGTLHHVRTNTEKLLADPQLFISAVQSIQQGAVLLRQMTCDKVSTKEFDGQSIAFVGCRMNNGGWPVVIAMNAAHSVVRFISGPPATLPALVSSLHPKTQNRPGPEWVELLRTVFGKPVPLATPADQEKFSGLLQGARAANAQGLNADAERMLREALTIQTRLLGENDPAIADTLMDLALSLSNRGRREEAEILFTRASAIVQNSPRDSDRARLFSYYGFHAANQGDYEGGLRAGLNAVDAWRRQLSAPRLNLGAIAGYGDEYSDDYLERGELGLALNLVANMALNLEDLGLASVTASEALSIFNANQGLPKAWRSDVLLTLGKISSAQGRLSAAETYFNSSLAERRQLHGDGPQTIQVLAALATAYQREGLLTSAIVTYREIFKLLGTLKVPPSAAITTEDLIPFGRAVTAYAQTLKDPNQIQGLFSEAFDAFQFVRPENVSQIIVQSALRLSSTNEEMQNLLDQLAQSKRRRDTTNTELTYEMGLPAEQRSKLVEDRLTSQRKQAEDEIAYYEQELAQKFPDYANLTKPKPLTLLEMRRRLGAQEGVVSFLIGRKESFVTLIRRDGIFIGQVKENEKSLAETVTALRRGLEIQGTTVIDFDLDRSFQLYKSLFGEVEPQLKGLTHLVVAPSGPLASLPFSVLVTQPPKINRYREAAWLVGQSAVSHVPSLQAFFSLRTIERSVKPEKKLFAIGNPILSGRNQKLINPNASPLATSCRQEGPVPPELISGLLPLPDTESELNSVSRALGIAGKDHLLVGKTATEENFRNKNLTDYRILYFATHGLLPGELKCQTEPGLVLTPPQKANDRANDGLLEASEIATMRVNADLVVLSACNTAGTGGRFGGDALSGLAESFFFAGARNLLVSHWQVPSTATTQLMSSLFEAVGPDLTKGISPSLQAAQQKMIAVDKTAHPFFWGAFVLVGDGAADNALPVPRGVNIAAATTASSVASPAQVTNKTQ